MTWQQGVLIYIGIGIILFTYRTIHTPRKEWYKAKDEVRKEFSVIPESLHPIASLISALIILGAAAFLILTWPKQVYNIWGKF